MGDPASTREYTGPFVNSVIRRESVKTPTKFIDVGPKLDSFDIDEPTNSSSIIVNRNTAQTYRHNHDRLSAKEEVQVLSQKYRADWYRVVMGRPTLHEETPPLVASDPPLTTASASSASSPSQKNNNHRGEIIADLRGPPSEAVRQRSEEVRRNKEQRKLKTLEKKTMQKLQLGILKKVARKQRQTGLIRTASERRDGEVPELETVRGGDQEENNDLDKVLDNVDDYVKEEISSGITQGLFGAALNMNPLLLVKEEPEDE